MRQRVLVRRGAYVDSVTLMLASQGAERLPGVEAAAAVMGTPVNLGLLARAGLEPPGDPEPGPNDLVVAVRAESAETLAAAVEWIDACLSAADREVSSSQASPPPRSIRTVARRRPGVNLAVLSVPGRYAAYEAALAVEEGLHVFCFSDGLSLEQESLLKRRAVERGLLFMGADCGTAIIDGVALGFANAVDRGPVGIVGASGTGIQEVACLLDAAGVGISQAIGVGGRDLSREVGGTMTLRALELLAADSSTSAIVVISKPPSPDVAEAVLEAAEATRKPVVLALLGLAPRPRTAGAECVATLEAAAARAAQLAGRELLLADPPVPPAVTPGAIRGLFSGGTLCFEAMAVVSAAAGPVASNIPLRPEWKLADLEQSRGHTFIDFGARALTEGRPHPMIDVRLRLERFEAEAADPVTGVVLLDVVLGYGAYADPAAELAPVIAEWVSRRAGSLSVVITVCGTRRDPQGLDRQVAALQEAGALVTRGAAAAARVALDAARLDGESR